MRINRYLARSGIASRRKAEELVLSGSVCVNGKITTNLATEISDNDIVEISGKTIERKQKVYYVLNKPRGYTTTRKDKHADHTVFELLPEDSSLYTVGRLDKETTGLILITNDGEFGQNIIHPTNKIEKEYEVTTKNIISDEELRKISNTIELDDGPAQFTSINKKSNNKIVVTIEEGRNRIVRRMISAIGNEARELNRSRVGKIKLDVELGKYRELNQKEVGYYV